MDIVDYIGVAILVASLSVPIYIVYDETVNTHVVCLEEGVVSDILSVNYRDATILTVKGREIVLNQSTVKDGDVLCLRSERVRNDEK